jgi:hypothetical protein
MANSVHPKLNPRKTPDKSAIAHIRICVDASLISRFLKFTERGFKLQIKTGLSIRELLCQHLGISEDYVDSRIQTIFLDGKPVDDVDTTSVENGSRLALSAAMPGLVGITFRKGGFYASLRSTISYSKTDASIVKGEGEIILKLFNMVAKELGPTFLENGIMIEGNAFQNFVSRNSEDLKAACISIHLNDEKTDFAGLLEMNWENTEIFLQVTSEETG